MPGTIRRQRWSPLNVPLWWAARQDETCPLVEWLISMTSPWPNPCISLGGDMAPSAAVRVGWTSFRAYCDRGALDQKWSCARPQQSHHSKSSRAHLDRVQRGRTSGSAGKSFRGAHIGGRTSHAHRRSCTVNVRIRRSEIPVEVPSGSWAQMDQVDLEEEFFRRTPMLKHSLSITLQERCRASLETFWSRSRQTSLPKGIGSSSHGTARHQTSPLPKNTVKRRNREGEVKQRAAR